MRPWIASVVLLAAACAKPEAASTTSSSSSAAPTPPPAIVNTTATMATAPPAAAPSGIASADGETSGAKAVVQELKRTGNGTVSLKFTITNGSDKRVNSGYNFADKDHEVIDHGTVGGVQLVDEAGKKKYLVVRDTSGKCVCSSGVNDIKPGETTNLWARFPAPPDTVQKITVIVPHFQPMDDVPISK